MHTFRHGMDTDLDLPKSEEKLSLLALASWAPARLSRCADGRVKQHKGKKSLNGIWSTDEQVI